MTEFQIACVGDVMCGDQFNQIGWGAASKIEKYGHLFVDPKIVAILTSHNITFANVECVLSDTGLDAKNVRSMHMRGRPESAVRLKEWGINAVNLANNHILEHGPLPAKDTVRNLKENKILVTGIDKDANFSKLPAWTETTIMGQRLSTYAFCLRDEKYAYVYDDDVVSLCEQIRKRKNAGDVVIISVHWGDELMDRPSLKQREIAAHLLNAGTTLVMGHHPHVVQGVWERNGSLVAYSLGNFIFDSWCQKTGWSMILSVRIDGQKVVGYSMIPIVRGIDFRPMLSIGKDRDRLIKEIDRRNQLAQKQPIDKKSYQVAYETELIKATIFDRISLWCRIISRFWKSSPRYWLGILARPIQRRLGRW